jgi:hypothetical protein
MIVNVGDGIIITQEIIKAVSGRIERRRNVWYLLLKGRNF